jgi:hypothetical protein
MDLSFLPKHTPMMMRMLTKHHRNASKKVRTRAGFEKLIFIGGFPNSSNPK